MECIGGDGSTESVTGLHWGQGLNGCALAGVALGGFVSIIGVPHNYCPLYGFVGLGQAEARLIKI